jgi:predicted homoserine dehydrogenase-like protein
MPSENETYSRCQRRADSLLGPILKAKADQAGVVITNTDGDEPGVAMTLYRYLRSLGLRPVAAGNLKGMVDYYRNPDTQRAFAEKNDQDARKVTSFADAPSVDETTVLANATGFHAGRRKWTACKHVREMAQLFLPVRCDRPVGRPSARSFTRALSLSMKSHLKKARWPTKLGDGPLRLHLSTSLTFRLPQPCGRAVFLRSTVARIAGPVCEVRQSPSDLKSGERLDGVGGFASYGLIDNTASARGSARCQISLSEGLVLNGMSPKTK